jgi:hypothetical protein
MPPRGGLAWTRISSFRTGDSRLALKQFPCAGAPPLAAPVPLSPLRRPHFPLLVRLPPGDVVRAYYIVAPDLALLPRGGLTWISRLGAV